VPHRRKRRPLCGGRQSRRVATRRLGAPEGSRLSTQNHLIELLARDDRRRLLAICEPVGLVLGQVVYEPALPARHVYFPLNSFISLVAMLAGSPGVEVGMVGREGMLGSQLALGGGATPLRA